jgi:hypothetical protein
VRQTTLDPEAVQLQRDRLEQAERISKLNGTSLVGGSCRGLGLVSSEDAVGGMKSTDRGVAKGPFNVTTITIPPSQTSGHCSHLSSQVSGVVGAKNTTSRI